MKCLRKPKAHSTYIKYGQYRNMYNKLKQIAKTKTINLFKNHSKNVEITSNNDWEK